MTNETLFANDELANFGYEVKLNRTLNVFQLTAFGLIYLQPIGPAVIFGLLLSTSHGTVALPYFFAFIGMLFTLFSYSILIKEFPLSGSIYNYTKIIAGPFSGFIAGWVIALDYLLIPTLTAVSAATVAHLLIPLFSYRFLLLIFISSMSILNLIGVRITTLIGSILLLIQIGIVLAAFVVWINFIVQQENYSYTIFSIQPFYFDTMQNVIKAGSLALFSFLGFDAISTLAEESLNPQRDIPKAMFFCMLIGFILMFLTGYIGVLALPNWQILMNDNNWLNTTLFELSKLTGGNLFSLIYTIGYISAMIITNLVGTTAISRLLYSIGRDHVNAKNILYSVNKKWKTPHKNIFIISIVQLILGSFANLDQLAELINYGAISGFIF